MSMFAPSNEAPPQAVLTNRSSNAVTPLGAENFYLKLPTKKHLLHEQISSFKPSFPNKKKHLKIILKKIPPWLPQPKKKTINIAIHGFFTPMPPSPWALESPHAPPFLPPVAKVKVPQLPQVQQECLEASYQRLRRLEVPTDSPGNLPGKMQVYLPKALASIDIHDYNYNSNVCM